MLVRNGHGEWLPLNSAASLPHENLRTLFGTDLAPLLNLPEARHVLAFEPQLGPARGPDAICLTPHGRVSLAVSTYEEAPQDTLMRLMTAAGVLRGITLAEFQARLDLPTFPGEWLAERGSERAAAELDAQVAESLLAGSFEFLVIGPDVATALRPAFHFLDPEGIQTRFFQLEFRAAGEVQAVDGYEVPLDGDASLLRLVSERPAVPEASEPEPAAEPAQESEPVSVAPVEEAPAPLDEQVGVPDMTSFASRIDLLDEPTSSHMRMIVQGLQDLLPVVFTEEDGQQFMTLCLTDGDPESSVVELSSSGTMVLALACLNTGPRRDIASHVARILPDVTLESLEREASVIVEVGEHLNDVSLVEYLLEDIVDVYGPSGRSGERSTQPDASDAEEIDDSYLLEAMPKASASRDLAGRMLGSERRWRKKPPAA